MVANNLVSTIDSDFVCNNDTTEIIGSQLNMDDFCSIEDCKMKQQGVRGLIIQICDQKIPATCLLCTHLIKKEMNIELKVKDAVKALEGK
jgi:hypothetical protein